MADIVYYAFLIVLFLHLALRHINGHVNAINVQVLLSVRPFDPTTQLCSSSTMRLKRYHNIS